MQRLLPTDPAARLIRVDQVLKLSAMPKSSLYAAIAAGKFPAPIKLSERSSAWVLAEVEQWVEQRIALSRPAPRLGAPV
jgi:prophage regulatory protein